MRSGLTGWLANQFISLQNTTGPYKIPHETVKICDFTSTDQFSQSIFCISKSLKLKFLLSRKTITFTNEKCCDQVCIIILDTEIYIWWRFHFLFQNIIEEIKAKMTYKYPRDLRYRRLVNGYRTFDLSRGMDYILDVGFRDLHTGREVIKRWVYCFIFWNL